MKLFFLIFLLPVALHAVHTKQQAQRFCDIINGLGSNISKTQIIDLKTDVPCQRNLAANHTICPGCTRIKEELDVLWFRISDDACCTCFCISIWRDQKMSKLGVVRFKDVAQKILQNVHE